MTQCPAVVSDPDAPGRMYQCIRDRHVDTLHLTRNRQGLEIRWGGQPARKGPPAPANMAAMSAAYASGDSDAIAREVAIYDQQLLAGGYRPSTPAPRLNGLEH
jgi:hypothetical protein